MAWVIYSKVLQNHKHLPLFWQGIGFLILILFAVVCRCVLFPSSFQSIQDLSECATGWCHLGTERLSPTRPSWKSKWCVKSQEAEKTKDQTQSGDNWEQLWISRRLELLSLEKLLRIKLSEDTEFLSQIKRPDTQWLYSLTEFVPDHSKLCRLYFTDNGKAPFQAFLSVTLQHLIDAVYFSSFISVTLPSSTHMIKIG